MSELDSILSIEDRKSKCLLCNHELLKSEKFQNLSQKGWSNFKEAAKNWSEINIPLEDPVQNFTQVYNEIENLDEPFGKAHTKCRTIFSTKNDIYIKQ